MATVAGAFIRSVGTSGPVTSWVIQEVSCTGTSPNFHLSRPAHTPNKARVPGAFLFASDPGWRDLLRAYSSHVAKLPSSTLLAGGTFTKSTFGTLFFERMHVFPASENIGTILATVTSHFQYLNAYRDTSQQLTAITLSGQGLDGTTIEDTATSLAPVFPLTLNEMVSRRFDFAVLGTGDSAIDIDFDFTMADAAVLTPTFNVVGQRAVMFPFIPQRPISETVEFLTDVLAAYDGTEQRVSVRTQARQKFDMRYYLEQDSPSQGDSDKFSTAQALVVGLSGRPLGVGMWHQARKLTADVAIGASTVSLDASDIDFRVGGYAVLYSDWDDNEIMAIQSVTSNSVTFVTPTTKSFTTYDYLVPMQLCVADDGVEFSQSRRNLATVRAKWTSNDTADLGDYTTLYSRTWAPPGASYSAIPVVDDHNILTGKELKEEIDIDYDKLDPGTGDIAYTLTKTTPTFSTQKRWETDTMADTMALRKFIYWAKGRLKTFWFPSNREDFRAAVAPAIGSNDLSVYYIGYSDRVGTNAPYDHIRITYKSGTAARTASPNGSYHKITNATQPDPAVAEELLTLTHDGGVGWTMDIPLADIEQICFLFKTRFQKDASVFTHEGQGRAGLTMPVVGVKQ